MQIDHRSRWEERYRTGPRPWDTGVTPPEVVALWQQETVVPGRVAVDIGCGTGTNSAFLAGIGFTTVGLDLSLGALRLAQQRRERLPASVQQHLHFAQADVSRLPFIGIGALYMLDIGCFHAIPAVARHDYTKGIIANLAPGGYFHLYAFDLVPEEADIVNPRGLGETEIVDLFTPRLSIVEIIRARPDRRPCRWYLLRNTTH